MDLSFYTDTVPKTGETVVGNTFASGQGGKGANQAVAAARLGASVAMVAKVGTDFFGKNFISALQSDNIDTASVKISQTAHTGMANIVVDTKSGDNSIIIVPGANFDLNESDIDSAKEVIQNAKVIVVQLEIRPEVVKYALQIAKASEHPPITIVNPAPAIENERFPAEIYELADIFCPNETETMSFLNLSALNVKETPELEKALHLFKKRGCKGDVLLTLGASGVFTGKGIVTAPSVETVVDTTGAGDAFVGALSYFSATFPAMPLEEKVRRSCIIASDSVKRKGTQSSYPKRCDLPSELFQF